MHDELNRRIGLMWTLEQVRAARHRTEAISGVNVLTREEDAFLGAVVEMLKGIEVRLGTEIVKADER